MFSFGKCPKCEKICGSFTLQEVDASAGIGQKVWRALTFLCPHCQTIVGVQIDPIAIKTDTVNDLAKRLKGGN
jgi:hypothetical protein